MTPTTFSYPEKVELYSTDLAVLVELIGLIEDRAPREALALARLEQTLAKTQPWYDAWAQVRNRRLVSPGDIASYAGVTYRVCAGCRLPISQEEYDSGASHTVSANLPEEEFGDYHDECCPAQHCREQVELMAMQKARTDA